MYARRVGRVAPRFVAAATLALIALAGSAAAPAQAVIPSTSGIHLWLFDPGNGTAVNTTAEAQWVARNHDLVVVGAPYRPFLSAMHAAHPGLLVLRYRSGIAAKKGTQLQWVLANHPGWLARDADGAMLTNSFGNALLDVSNPAVVTYQASWAAGQAKLGWDGIYLDAVGVFGIEGFSGHPIDPATGLPFTYDSWVGATRDLAAAMDAAVALPVVTNGYRNGRYFAGLTDFGTTFGGTQHAARRRPGRRVRVVLPASAGRPRRVPRREHLRAPARGHRSGPGGRPLGAVPGEAVEPATSAQRLRWHGFALAGFLLAAQDHAYFHFYGSRDASPLEDWGESALAIGAPLEQRRLVSGVYLRRYQNAIVVANPTVAAVTVSLGGSYRLPGGATGTSLKAGADRGYVLMAIDFRLAATRRLRSPATGRRCPSRSSRPPRSRRGWKRSAPRPGTRGRAAR